LNSDDEASSFGPGSFKYQAFACYSLNNGAQKLDQFGVWTRDQYVYAFSFFPRRTKLLPRNGIVARGLGETHLNPSVGDVVESGALFSFAGTPTEVNIRVGVSFVSGDQACTNAASEIGTATFDEIQAQSKSLWNERLSRIEIDVPRTPPNVTELLYSSLYRASLTPVGLFILESTFKFLTCRISKNNATGEAQGDFAGTSSFYFDSLYCRLVYLLC
jgi:putative alpha-1,2-mannosidase